MVGRPILRALAIERATDTSSPSRPARSFAEFLDKQEHLQWHHDKLASAALAKIPGFLT